MKGTWEHERSMKGHECKMKGRCMQIRETRRTMHANEMDDFVSMLDLEYADFHETRESDRIPPKAISITIATTQMQRILTGAHMFGTTQCIDQTQWLFAPCKDY